MERSGSWFSGGYDRQESFAPRADANVDSRPRWRFSLRWMLAVVALVSVLCAWCTAVWKRAEEQDALASSGLMVNQLWVERSGPKWLRLVVPDRYRRRVVGVSISIGSTIWADEAEQTQNAKNRRGNCPGRTGWVLSVRDANALDSKTKIFRSVGCELCQRAVKCNCPLTLETSARS
jgi:hypothetical protein